MTNFIPIFPLHTIVYPGEEFELQTTSKKYLQLFYECYAVEKPFGLQFIIDNKSCEIGTSAVILELTKQYEPDQISIKAKAVEVFRILEVVKNMPDKLYDGAIVNYPNNDTNPHSLMTYILPVLKQIQASLNISSFKFNKPDEKLLSYDIAHQIKLSNREEYELLELMLEGQRLEYLKQHLIKN